MLVAAIGLAALLWSAAPAGAMANVLPPGLLIGDQTGLQVSRDGSYFLNATGLTPGQVITKRLDIRNSDEDAEPFRLTMTAQPLEASGPYNLLDIVHLTLELDGKPLYEGRLRGDEGVNMIRNPLDLGVYGRGDHRTLDITLTVSPRLRVADKSVAEFRWHFYAARTGKTAPPETGVGDRPSLIMLGLAAAFLTGIGVVMACQRRRDDAMRQAGAARAA
jgi:hypothetical protein